MKVLILGGTGILSTDVCLSAIEKKYEVTCVNRGNRSFVVPDGVKTHVCDVNEAARLREISEFNYDIVVDFLSYDLEHLKKKMEIFNGKCKQYIFISSAAAYSLVDEVITEKTPLGNPYWKYGQNKVECEKYLENNIQEFNFYYTIIRPYVTYGNTRIPFAIIPDGRYWSLANRIYGGKPILLWDDGKATCTVTHTKDFARGVVGIFNNVEARNEVFHITSNEKLTWKMVLTKLSEALECEAEVFSCSTEDIIKELPEYEGVLRGDKSRNKEFDNTKIKNAVDNLEPFIEFSDGIDQTVRYFNDNPHERKVSYYWDGTIDRAIISYARKHHCKIDKKKLGFYSYDGNDNWKNRCKYIIGRSNFLSKIYMKAKK